MVIKCYEKSIEPQQVIINKSCEDKNIYASDFCRDSYFQFTSGQTNLIVLRTGSGKSDMYINKIIPKAYQQKKRVLVVLNRSKLNDQTRKKMMESVIKGILPYDPTNHSLQNDYDNCLTLMTYQQLEYMIANDRESALKELDKIDIVIADEVHYFLSDATFNPKTRLSAEAVLMYLANKTRYLISATMDNVKPIILQPWKYFKPIFSPQERYYFPLEDGGSSQAFNHATRFTEYYMPEDYNYLDVYYFRKRESIIDYIVNSDKNEKCLCFVYSKSQGESLVKDINKLYKETYPNSKIDEPAAFISADYRNKDKEQMQRIMDEITRFEDTSMKVLVATSVLDNGINLKSTQLLNVVIHADNKVSFFQMLGRRRLLTQNDKVKLFIPAEDVSLFEKRKSKIETIINDINQISFAEFDRYMTELLYSGDELKSKSFCTVAFPMTEYVNGVPRSNFVINELSLYQLRIMRENYQKIIDRFATDGSKAFVLEQLSWLGINYDDSKWLPDNSSNRRKNELDQALSKYLGRQLSTEEYEKMLEEIKPIIRTVSEIVRGNRISTKQANIGLKLLSSIYWIDIKNRQVCNRDEMYTDNDDLETEEEEEKDNEK
jgi:superfamily II DNA or RNA helicase